MGIDGDALFRRELFDKARRVVIKVGSAILTNPRGIHTSFIVDLAREISLLRKEGREVILVSSGAVAAGTLRHQHPQEPAETGVRPDSPRAPNGARAVQQTHRGWPSHPDRYARKRGG